MDNLIVVTIFIDLIQANTLTTVSSFRAGGTIDLTVYEVARRGVLKELYRPTGGAWGGTKVDEAFKLFLVDVVGFEGVTEFKRLDMLALYRNFEQVKCMANFSEKVHVELPE